MHEVTTETANIYDPPAVSLRDRFKQEMILSLQPSIKARLARLAQLSCPIISEPTDVAQSRVDTETVDVTTTPSEAKETIRESLSESIHNDEDVEDERRQTRPTIAVNGERESTATAEDSPTRRARISAEEEIEEVFTEGALRALRAQQARQHRAAAHSDSEEEVETEDEDQEEEEEEEEGDLAQAMADYIELDEMMHAMGAAGTDDAEEVLAALMMADQRGF